MRAEIVSIGTELLLGEIDNTNMSYLAVELARLGIDLFNVVTVGDNPQRLLEALKQAWDRADLVLTTGGLGPTQDDITREIVAELLCEKIEIDRALKEEISGFFRKFRLDMPESNLKQASLIPSAIAIRNPLGTAPGWWVEKEGKILVTLPGPPRELKRMWAHEVFPRLNKLTGSVIVTRMIKTFGLPEATIGEMLSPWSDSPSPTVGIYAKPDGIHVRLAAKAANHEEAFATILRREEELKKVFGQYIWGMDDDTLEGAVVKRLCASSLTLAVVDFFSAGQLIEALAETASESGCLKGALLLPGTGAAEQIGFKFSEPAMTANPRRAEEAARLVRERFRADIGFTLDGSASKKEGAETGKAFIAIVGTRNLSRVSELYAGRGYQLRRRAVLAALFELLKFLEKP